MPEYSVLLVGCGEIAGGHDMHDHVRRPQTHAGAYAADARFRLAACVEPKPETREAFATYWNIPRAFETLDAAFADNRFDIVSICSPTATHAAALRRTLVTQPRFVFSEKPLANSIEEAADIVDAYERSGVALGVNYLRRWDPAVRAVAQELAEGKWGAVRTAVGLYTKGVLHNGSHMIDLVRQLLGDVELERTLDVTVDHDPADPVVSALLRTDTGIPVHLIAGDARDYPLFELTLVTEKGAIAFEGGGTTIRRRPVGRNPLFPEHLFLTAGTFLDDGIGETLSTAIANIGTTVAAGQPFACDSQTALATERICSEMLAQVRQ